MTSRLGLADLSGVWRRESIAISDGVAFEDSVVYWLQAGKYFADMRWPLEPTDKATRQPSAFAGHVQWSAPRIRFCHEIDYSKEHLEDVACIALVDGRLIERGKVNVANQEIEFEEVWMPCIVAESIVAESVVAEASPNMHVARATSGLGYIVHIHNFAIALWELGSDFSAACWHRADECAAWELLNSIGDARQFDAQINDIAAGLFNSNWQCVLQEVE